MSNPLVSVFAITHTAEIGKEHDVTVTLAP